MKRNHMVHGSVDGWAYESFMAKIAHVEYNNSYELPKIIKKRWRCVFEYTSVSVDVPTAVGIDTLRRVNGSG